MTLGLGGKSEDVDSEDDGEGDTKRLRDVGISSTFSTPSPGGIFEGRHADPVWQKL